MKNLFEISSEEKQRILEMHVVATKKQYLIEQLKKINIKVTDGKDPVVGAAIIDLGDRTNGAITDFNGEATFNKFTGPSFSVAMVGFKDKEVKPDNENVNVSLESGDNLKTLEITARPTVNIKIIDSETKEPIKAVIDTTRPEGAQGNKCVKGSCWNQIVTDDKGIFKFDFDNYLPEIEISKLNYETKKVSITWDKNKLKNDPYQTIELTKKYVPPVVPTELEFLIGKVFRFLDSKMKRPGWFKILEAQYVEDGNRTTTQLTTSYCQVQNKCDETPSFTIIYDCDRIAFKVQKISDAWSRKAIDFVIKNYLYCDDLQTYLLDNSKTKTCTLNKP
jgi:hypothetical protein